MEAAVDEVGGDVDQERPLDGVGYDEADVVPAQQGDDFGRGEAFVADLDAVTDGKARRTAQDVDGGAMIETVVVEFGDRGCLALCAGKEMEEILEALAIEAKLWRELPEDWTEFRAEFKQTIGEEVG